MRQVSDFHPPQMGVLQQPAGLHEVGLDILLDLFLLGVRDIVELTAEGQSQEDFIVYDMSYGDLHVINNV